MPMDLNKHKEEYLKEAKAHIQVMNRALIELEKSPNNPQYFKEIFHAIHSFKSLAATMNYEQSINLCHAVEDLFDAIRNKKKELSQEGINFLFLCFDQLNLNLKQVEDNKPEQKADHLIQEIRLYLDNGHNFPKEIRSSGSEQPAVVEKIKAIEVKVERLDVIMNIAEELLVTKLKFELIKEQVTHPELPSAVESLDRLITDLQYYVMQIRLMPVKFIFNRFIRMVRDLSRTHHKEIDFMVEGGDIELDRLIFDEVSESISHLIRNSIDHGIETPKVREAKGKPETGALRLSAIRTKEAVVIELSDDGAGIDFNKIKEIAVQNNLLSPNADYEEIKNIIFTNFSTTEIPTETSGRGLGLSIVKEKIEALGGTIQVESVPDQGTAFLIHIPLTLAIIRMLFVKVAEETYAIPIDSVERLLIASPEDFKGLINDEAILFEDKEIPVVRLAKLFGRPVTRQLKQPVVIVQRGSNHLGLVVDDLVSTQEIVIKPLGRAVKDNRYFSGATMIGSGDMVLIIDTAYLLKLINRKQLTT